MQTNRLCLTKVHHEKCEYFANSVLEHVKNRVTPYKSEGS